MSFPEYDCKRDQDRFMRELEHYVADNISPGAARNVRRLAEDLDRVHHSRDSELRELREYVAELEDAHFKMNSEEYEPETV